MSRRVTIGLFLFILIGAAALRFTGLDWDGYYHHHPDERYITWVATTIEWPQDWRTAWRPQQSTFNPFYWPAGATSAGISVIQDAQRKFAYGHLPLYLGVAATRLMEVVGSPLASLLPADWLLTADLFNGRGAIEFRHLTAVSRALTAVTDLATVAVVFLLGRRLYDGRVGLLAAALLAVNVMHVQLAHFFTVDPFLSLFVVTAVYFMVRSIRDGGAGDASIRRLHTSPLANLFIAAIFIGLAVGSKFAAVLLVIPLTLSFWFWQGRHRAWWWGAALLAAGLTFFVTNPFAILDLSCKVITPEFSFGPLDIPAINWRSCYLENIVTQSAMVRGDIDLPFTRQYIGTLPYLYPIEMQLRWGMGPLLGTAAFAGFGWVAWRMIRRLNSKKRPLPPVAQNHAIVLAWTVPFFLTTGGFFVKFMRYLLPLTPFLMIYAAAMLLRLPHRRLRWGVVTFVVLGTGLYALSFSQIYRQPHPWVSASEWIYANVDPGTLILSEQWDDPLPTTMLVDGDLRRLGEYENAELTWLTRQGSRDNEAALDANLALLAEADYLVVTSHRAYGVVPRLPQRFPVSSQYHQLLFDGELGYELVGAYGRFPRLGAYYLKPDTFTWPALEPPPGVANFLAQFPGLDWGRADESFLVYDQPLTLIFQNMDRRTAAEMKQVFVMD